MHSITFYRMWPVATIVIAPWLANQIKFNFRASEDYA